jgi:chromosome partitioning protein
VKPFIIAVVNQKGGVGKTTIGAAVAQFWAETLDVVLVDWDPQASASQIFLEDIGNSVFDAIVKPVEVNHAIVPALSQYPPRLRILPASPRLTELDAMLAGNLDRFHCAQDLLKKVTGAQIIVCDCPGTMSLLTIAPLVAADFVLIPTSCEPMAFDQIDRMKETIAAVQRRLNPQLRILPLAATLFDTRTRLDHEVLAELRARHEVFITIVRRRIRIKEEFAARVACTSEDLRNLANEILERIYYGAQKIHTEPSKD